MQICNLSFADDLLLFCKAGYASILSFIEALNEFAALSGLHINKDKSQVILGGVQGSIKQDSLDATSFTEGKFPFRYPGVPISSASLNQMDCAKLAVKITAKIDSLGQQTFFLCWTGSVDKFCLDGNNQFQEQSSCPPSTGYLWY